MTLRVVCGEGHSTDLEVLSNGCVSSRADFCGECESPILQKELILTL